MSSNATRMYYAAAVANVSALGPGGASEPLVDGIVGVGSSTALSILSEAQTRGARLVVRPYGGGAQVRGVNSEFSVLKWKGRISDLTGRVPAAQMAAFVADGTVLGLILADDIKPGGSVFPGGVPTFAEFEEMAEYVKSFYTTLPTTVRAENQYLRDICVAAGASHYTQVDFGWAQWRDSRGAPLTWFTNHINAGRQVKLGGMLGASLLAGGSGDTAPWDFQLTAFGRVMSPQELTACADAFSALTTSIGFAVWTQDPLYDTIGYWNWESIQTSLVYWANKAIDKEMGPINWRDISGSTSGSTQTVAGAWAYTAGSQYRTGGTNTVNVSLPTSRPAGSMLGVLAYSRDERLSPETPSGWSEAHRISGDSAQGGELALFYRLADGLEPSKVAVAFSGTPGTGDAVMCRSFGFSGNTTTSQAAMLSTKGSARSWAAGTSNWGPIPGLTSAVSDALVLICAGRANDFSNGDPPPDDTISATTFDNETWNRAYLVTHISGDDAAMFMDYATLSGTPSITTKSWTALSGSGSASSGAGCGFMVSFAPSSIVSGQPPAIEPPNVFDPDDVTISVASTFSFKLASTGSTPITWSLTSGPSNVTLDSSSGTFTWSPLSVGTFFMVVTATNSFGTDAAEFSVFVVSSGATAGGGSGSANAAPSITHPGDKTVNAHDLLSFIVVASDADADPMEFQLDSAPQGAFIDSVTGQFIWIPSGDQGPGVYPIVVLVSDGQAESRSTFTVTVNDTIWTREGGPSTQLGRTSPVLNSFTRIL